jgi:hypothetical protein
VLSVGIVKSTLDVKSGGGIVRGWFV